MCGRFGFTKPKDQIMKRFNLERAPEHLSVLYNISPSQNAPVILNKYPKRVGLLPLRACPFLVKRKYNFLHNDQRPRGNHSGKTHI